MALRPGQKVVCVNAGGTPGFPAAQFSWDRGEEIFEGRIYTIHSTFIAPIWGPSVRLFEVKRTQKTILQWGHDGYGAFRFRPAVERKTDISELKALLNPTTEDVAAFQQKFWESV